MNFNYYMPTKILFGAGKLAELAHEELPGTKALIVISSGNSMRKHGYLGRLQEILREKGIASAVFDKILPNPVKSHVMEGAALCKEENCDFVIGLGGGSSIDSAKSIAIMAKNPGDYWDYVGGGTGKGQPIPNGLLPVVAITTTAGTGTEADPWTVITNEETNEKIGFGNQSTFPTLSVVDPELMLSVPPTLTAYQGFDALFHSLEGYIANVATSISDMYALRSIELVNQYLPECVAHGDNLEARTKVALANTYAGFVQTESSCTSEHSMEHALSAFYPDLPHGAGLILLSDAYFTFFSTKIPQRFAGLAKAMGAGDSPESFLPALRELKKKCGVADLKMSDWGIKADDIPKLAQNARETMGGLFAMDRYQLSLEETIEIMEKAYR
ncbi:MAG: iron-containing alcohol dehydrogenase [Limnochordia bacterium]|jgi:alcohol dehydrogenase|nr:iron-containing alcohol dehydrogenase [Limnochordia bacterium]